MTRVADILVVKPGSTFQLPGDAAEQKFGIQKNHQNSLKGVIWGAVGSAMTVASPTLTAATVAAAVVGVFGAAFVSPPLTDLTELVLGERVAAPLLLGLATTAGLVDYCFVKLNGYCFRNSIYHLGPKYQIVELK